MPKIIIGAPLVAGAAWVLAVALPAEAAPTGETPVTLQVNGGTLDITVPAGPVTLGAVTGSGSAQTVTNTLGNVAVSDNRDGTAGWTVTANGVDFTGPQNISVSAPGSSSYSAPPATVTGTATVTATNLSPIYPPSPVQTATGVSGINTATWDPTISVTIPANALAGTYSSTITHSVA